MCKLYFRYSPMNSGKSLQLLAQAHQFEERNIPFLCLKSALDTRDGEDVISSRTGLSRECITIGTSDNLYELMERFITESILQGMEKPLWLLIDEAQFLSSKQVDQLGNIVDKLDINVMCYGLRTDFLSKLFDGSKRLMELADDIDEIKTYCSCGGKAIMNARFDSEGNILTEGEQIVIGGNEMYIPLCRKCYNAAIARKYMQDKDNFY